MQDGQISGEQGHIGRLERTMCSLDDETFVSSCVCVHLETLAKVFRVSVNECVCVCARIWFCHALNGSGLLHLFYFFHLFCVSKPQDVPNL